MLVINVVKDDGTVVHHMIDRSIIDTTCTV